MFESIMAKVKANPKTIVFPEGTDARILEAASRLLADSLMKVILVGDRETVKKTAIEKGFDISGAEIIDPKAYPGMDDMAEEMAVLRKGKMSVEECKKALLKGNYFGTMLVKSKKADCLLGGATYSTADTIRPALQLVKTRPGAHFVSSCMILHRDTGEDRLKTIAMGDCAVNLDYKDDVDKDGNVKITGAEKLAEVAREVERCARVFGIEPKLAMLSFSTNGSGKGATAELSSKAATEAKRLYPEMNIDGEMQFDAAVAPSVGQLKFPGSKVAGYANCFIFPNIEAGNIGYKIAQRLGDYAVYGPILLGLNAPINDLSRGCNADEVYKMAIITAAL